MKDAVCATKSYRPQFFTTPTCDKQRHLHTYLSQRTTLYLNEWQHIHAPTHSAQPWCEKKIENRISKRQELNIKIMCIIISFVK